MATWMIHFRVADYFARKYPELNNDDFIVGNIGPDCSIVDENTGRFDPPFNVTHFTETGRKLDMNIDKFYEEYIANCDTDHKGFKFYIGYYVHLLTDYLWTKTVWLPTKERFKDEFTNAREFLNIVREDWWNHDHIFLKDNPAPRVFEKFCLIESYDNDFLGFYRNDSITRRLSSVREAYDIVDDIEKDINSCKYHTSDMGDKFIVDACMLIEKELLDRVLSKIG